MTKGITPQPRAAAKKARGSAGSAGASGGSVRLTNAEMVKQNKENLIRDGGRVVNTLRLRPEAAKALARLEAASDMSATAIINDLLIQRGKRLKE